MSSEPLESFPGPSHASVPIVHKLVSKAVSETGNGSTNGSSDTPAWPRKRHRWPETWKKNLSNVKRAKGEDYISPYTGELVPGRKNGPSCRCKRRKCFDLFSTEEKEGIIRDFNDIGDKHL